jgi:hypothetical protein
MTTGAAFNDLISLFRNDAGLVIEKGVPIPLVNMAGYSSGYSSS